MTTSQVLKQLQTISKRHFNDKPQIGMDSLALALGKAQAELKPHLAALEQSGYISLKEKSISITEAGMDAFA